MKEGIHPEYHSIKVVMTDGSSFETRSTYGKEGDTLQLDVDPKTHPAWTGGGGHINENASQVAKFNKRFGGFKMVGAAPKGASAAKPKAETAAASAKPKSEAPTKKKEKKAEE